RGLTEWRWSDEKATLDYCMAKHLPDHEINRTKFEALRGAMVDIRRKSDGKSICKFESPTQAVLFARRNNVLYLAEYLPTANGCVVAALDLDSGKRIWTNALLGVDAVDCPKYHNRVNIDVEGENVVVFGNETNGRYVEVLNAATGKLVTNRK